MEAINYIQQILITVEQIVQQFLRNILYHETAFIRLLLSYPAQLLNLNKPFIKNNDVNIKDFCGKSGFISIMAPENEFSGAKLKKDICIATFTMQYYY